jgi:bla regulator protein blaR1
MMLSFVGSVSGSVLDTALESAARSLLAAGVVWVGLRAFRIRSVPAQKAVWGLVLAAAVAMPLLMPMAARWRVLPIGATVVLPSSPLKLFAAETPSPKMPSPAHTERFDAPANAAEFQDLTSLSVSAPSQPADNIGNYIADEARRTTHDADAIPNTESIAPLAQGYAKPAQVTKRPISILEFAWMLYVSVTAGLLLRMILGIASALRLWHRAEPVPMDAFPGADALHLRASDGIASPMTIGSGVVLPADYAEWDAEKLRIVLAHERSHIRQGDFYLQLLAGFYAIVFWFSPLGWWLKRRLSDLAEAISDRAGLCEAASRSSYAQILLEFAAKPRPTHLGVAMARQGSLSCRIDRVLNDSAFQLAFAASRLRVAAAVLLVPMAVFAATTLIRVKAAAQTTQPAQPAPAGQPAVAPQATTGPAAEPAAAPEAGQSNPPAEPILASPQAPAAPGEEMQVVVPPIPPIGPIRVVVPKMDVVVPKMTVVMPNMPPMPKMIIRMPELAKLESLRLMGPGVYSLLGPNVIAAGNGQAYVYRYSTDGDTLVLVKRNGGNEQLSENWADGHRESIEKARKQAHGNFLWFTHKGKAYFIDDPAIVSSIEASMDALHAQQEELGKQQEALGRQQEVLAKQQSELAQHLAQASMRTPDLSEAIAKVQAALAELKARQGSTMTTQEWASIENKLGELQTRLGAMRGETGAKMGAFGDKQGALGAQQGKLGEEQGKLGERQAQMALEMQTKVNSMVYQSLQDGKAHPVQ